LRHSNDVHRGRAEAACFAVNNELGRANGRNIVNAAGYDVAPGLVPVLKAWGDGLSLENILKQLANLRDLQVPMRLPGVKWNTSPTDFFLIDSAQPARFDGKEWALFGKVIGR